jgi:hypothetical protein
MRFRRKMFLALFMVALLALAYYVKDKLGIDLLKHRHFLIFRE